MGRPKQQTSRINKHGNSSSNMDRKTNGKGSMRSKATIQRLNMYNSGKPKRDKDGKITGGPLVMNNESGGKAITGMARVAPDRRWFGNTRTIAQKELDKFRDDMSLREADPYSVILRRKKIPMALLQDSKKIKSVNLLETESFDVVFGGKNKRKKPKLSEALSDSYAALAQNAATRVSEYHEDPTKDSDNVVDDGSHEWDERKGDVFAKGQSKRIWGELYKVLDCSDVVLQIVDARNVPGTRCFHVENHIKKNASHKQLVIIINKCDLVPNWVTRRWVKILSEDFPTIAFHAHMTKNFGKSALINLLRQFSKLHADKRNISVGCIGYPNVGKSSIINVLVGSKCCKAAPIPGETKVWQYISLTKRISLIDCPGIVYNNTDDSEVETVLKGVVRAERLETPVDFIPAILSRVKPEYICKQYDVEWTPADEEKNSALVLANDEDHEKHLSHVQFLTKLANKMGKLLKGNEPDLRRVAVIVINDWQRVSEIPFRFVY